MFKALKWIALICLVALVAGCGEKTETTKYFYSPTWARDGRILMVGATQSVNKDNLGSQLSSSYSEYVFSIYPSGTGESSPLFNTTDNPPYAMTCSPATDYVAYGNDLMNNLYRTIVIQNIAIGQHSGIEKLELAFAGVQSFDWSNDGTKLVYCTSSEVRTVNINGSNDTLVTQETSVDFVTWKYGGRIAFVHTPGASKILSLIYPDGSGRVDLAAASSVSLPQISAVNTNEVFGKVGDTYIKVNVNTGTTTPVVTLGFVGELPRLSSTAKQLTYSKSGQSSGVYVLGDVSTATPSEKRLK
ncbi:MAG: hypothetical protein PHH60_03600 [Candidatus Margulisbacteria bacterium]|nr:hypothetical protein [Candidatus Margulisiibacteriota bacterium]